MRHHTERPGDRHVAQDRRLLLDAQTPQYNSGVGLPSHTGMEATRRPIGSRMTNDIEHSYCERPPVPTIVLEMRQRAFDNMQMRRGLYRWMWKRQVKRWDNLIWRWNGGRYV